MVKMVWDVPKQGFMMRERAGKFARLSRAEKVRLVEAFIWLSMVKIGLFLLPFKSMRRLIETRLRPESGKGDAAYIDQVVWAVQTASHYVPTGATCLTQALTVQMLLGRRGYPTQLHIGVTQDDSGQLKGHAWVEREGQVLIGGTELAGFTKLFSRDAN
jgi:hypothetical protein